MTTDADIGAQESAPLSIEDAAAALRGAAGAPPPREEEGNSGGAPGAEADGFSAEDLQLEPTSEAADSGEDLAGEPAEPAIPPPVSWDAEAKAAFAQLPRELQTKVADRETQREQALSQANERAAGAQREAQVVGHLKEALQTLVPQLQQKFADRWGDVDWVALARTDPDQYIALHAEYQAEQEQVQRLTVAQQLASQEADRRFMAQREEELRTKCPALCDPKESGARRQALLDYLVGEGIPGAAIRQADATMLALAYKAHLYDKAVAARTARGTPPPPAPAPKPLRPGAPGSASRISSHEAAMRRLDQSGDVDDAVAVLAARRK